jgi:hypothetical protein
LLRTALGQAIRIRIERARLPVPDQEESAHWERAPVYDINRACRKPPE